jgi:hypothetical protein
LPGFAIARFFPVPEKPAHPPGVQRSTWLCPANAEPLCAGQRKPQKQQNFASLPEKYSLDFFHQLSQQPGNRTIFLLRRCRFPLSAIYYTLAYSSLNFLILQGRSAAECSCQLTLHQLLFSPQRPEKVQKQLISLPF